MATSTAPATLSKGGRPRSFDRDAALNTALNLFWRHGYDGVAISDLTGAIGIAAPSLYAAFGSKAELYREALARYQAYGQELGGLSEDGTAYEAVAAALENAVGAVARPGRPPGCMVSSGLLACSPEAEGLADEHRRLRAMMVRQFRTRIAKGIRAGELPPGANAASIARFYVTVLQGISVQARDGIRASELRSVIETALAAWPRKRMRN